MKAEEKVEIGKLLSELWKAKPAQVANFVLVLEGFPFEQVRDKLNEIFQSETIHRLPSIPFVLRELKGVDTTYKYSLPLDAPKVTSQEIAADDAFWARKQKEWEGQAALFPTKHWDTQVAGKMSTRIDQLRERLRSGGLPLPSCGDRE